MNDEETRKEEQSKETEAQETVGESASEEAAGSGGGGQEESGSSESSESSGPEASGADLEDELEKYREELMRAKAEMQNIRRRSEIDVEKAHKFALEKFVKELLPVVDSLEKAVESAEGHEVQNEEVVARIKEGVDMTLDMFQRALGKFNIRQINPVGEPFDPQQHEAMSMVPSAEAEPNSVIAVMQKGYMLNERVVRPAMVMVAKAEESSEGGNVDEQA